MNAPALLTGSKRHVAKLAVVIFWMLAIFLLSNEPASESSVRSGRVVDLLSDYVSTGGEDISTFLVRKSAHIFMFFVLGILLYVLMRSYAFSAKKRIAISVGIAFCYAVFDEIHQTLVPGRSGEARDVLIDTIGASLGVLLCYAVLRYRDNKKLAVDKTQPTD